MKIIQANKVHLDLVAKLFNEYRVFYGQDSDVSRANDFINERLNNSDSIIILVTNESESDALAFAQIYPSFTSIGTGNVFILNDLYVAPAHRNKSIAKKLLDYIKEFAKKNEVTKVTLQTALSNDIAQKLYESSGYKKNDEFVHYSLEI